MLLQILPSIVRNWSSGNGVVVICHVCETDVSQESRHVSDETMPDNTEVCNFFSQADVDNPVVVASLEPSRTACVHERWKVLETVRRPGGPPSGLHGLRSRIAP